MPKKTTGKQMPPPKAQRPGPKRGGTVGAQLQGMKNSTKGY